MKFDALHFYTAPGLILDARLIVSNVTGIIIVGIQSWEDIVGFWVAGTSRVRK